MLEKWFPADASGHQPVCLAGARACPPEDCGGIWGDAELVEAIRHLKHERHGELLEWPASQLDAEASDLDEVNRRLRAML